MLSRAHLMKQNYKQNRLRQHFEQAKPPLTPGAVDLLEKMLCLDPKRRITAIEAFGVRAPKRRCHVLLHRNSLSAMLTLDLMQSVSVKAGKSGSNTEADGAFVQNSSQAIFFYIYVCQSVSEQHPV